MKHVFSVLLMLTFAFGSCSDDNGSKETYLAFTLDSTEVEFLNGMTPARIVEVLSGNGEYSFDIVDENIVGVQLIEGGDYRYGAFRFSPKALGSTIVTLRDVRGHDFKQVSVSVDPPGVRLNGITFSVDIKMEDQSLAREIQADIMLNPAFVTDYSYLMSGKDKDLIYSYEKSSYKGMRNFGHVKDGTDPYLIINDESSQRRLQVVKDVVNITHSYSYFYDISIPNTSSVVVRPEEGNTTRAENEVLPEVWFREDLTDYYKQQVRYSDVEYVSVLYMCPYEFAAFRER